jgi:hypothetical protein
MANPKHRRILIVKQGEHLQSLKQGVVAWH